MPGVPDAGFTEVADRCWVARLHCHEPGDVTDLDVNVGLVGGEGGLLLVDTGSSEAAAARVLQQVRRLGVGEVMAVFNTHEHSEHTAGNVVISEAYGGPPVVAHEAATRVPMATETFSSARVIDLGGRQVELVHPGRGHTAGDAVARVPDADLVFVGDLVEGSTDHAAVPRLGPDCYPLEWPAALDLVTGLLSDASVVVPGHGRVVGRDAVEQQRQALGVVAETIRDLAHRGVAVADALGAAEWPYPAELLADAVRRGREQLPRTGRSLPLL